MVSAVGDDAFGYAAIDHCKALGIDTTDILISDHFPTASYTAIHNYNGEMLHAVSDMRLFDQLQFALSGSQLASILVSDAIVIDANLPSAAIVEIVANSRSKLIVADAVSSQKSTRLLPVIESLDLIKVNRTEACVLSNAERSDSELSQALLNQGVKEVLLTLGSKGAVLSGFDQQTVGVPVYEPTVVSTTGAGDALLSAVLAARLYGLDKQEQLQWGIIAAAHTLGAKAACADTISYNVIKNTVREHFIQ